MFYRIDNWQLKSALADHFFRFGNDHAEILKHYIDDISAALGLAEAHINIEDPPEVMELPQAIARLAPQSTVNPPRNLGEYCSIFQLPLRLSRMSESRPIKSLSPLDAELTVWFFIGLLGTLPLEIRDLIYQYVFSLDCPAHDRACKCIRKERRARSGVGLLRSSGIIYNESIPHPYTTEFFGIHLGYERAAYDYKAPVRWVNPVFYRHVGVDHQPITLLPHNAFRLIRNLELDSINETLIYEIDTSWPLNACTDKFQLGMLELCTNLRDSVQLQHLDINISFACKFEDIDDMARLLAPIKILRNVRNPDITVYGYQYEKWIADSPRWDLTAEYANYLKELLMSPLGTTAPSADGIQVFKDCFESSESDEEDSEPDEEDSESDEGDLESDEENSESDEQDPEAGEEEQVILNYLRDVYGTGDLQALHGGMPEQWRVWLDTDVRLFFTIPMIPLLTYN